MEEDRGVARVGTHVGSTNDKPSNEFIYGKMRLFINSCWFIITDSLFWLFSFIAMHLFRIRKGNRSQRHDLDASLVNDSRRVDQNPEVTDSYTGDDDSVEEKESPSFSFKFQYQFNDHHMCQDQELQKPVAKENKSSMNSSIHNYSFLSEKDFSGFMEEPEAKTCQIQETCVDPDASFSYDNKNFSTKRSTSFVSSRDYRQQSLKAANHDSVQTVDRVGGIEDKKFLNFEQLEQERPVSLKTNFSGEFESTDQARFLSEEFSGFHFDSESLSASDGYSAKNTNQNTSFVSSQDCHQLRLRAANHDTVHTIDNLGGTKNYKFLIVEPLAQEKPRSSKTNLSDEFKRNDEARFLFELSGFDSDTESLSASDGYSMKDTKRNSSFVSSKDCHQLSVKAANHDTVHTIGELGGIKDKKFQNVEQLEQEKPVSSKTNLTDEFERTDQARFLSEDFSGFDSGTESLSASDGYSVKDLIVDSDSDGFWSERSINKYEHQVNTRYQVKLLDDIRRLEETQLQFTHNYDTEYTAANGKFSFVKNHRTYANINQDDKLAENESDKPEREQKGLGYGEAELNQVQKFEESMLLNLNALKMELTDSNNDDLHAAEKNISVLKRSHEVLSSNDLVKPDYRHENLDEKGPGDDKDNDSIDNTVLEFSNEFNVSHDGLLGSVPITEKEDALLRAELDELEWEELDREKKVSKERMEKKETDKKVLKYLEDLEDEDYDELESLWEHQDLIEQLKLELKRVRTISLPTIPEESEAPKTVEDLKPWKIEEKFLHKDPMDELHKFYKSYQERMRKFDILNYQKMYAIGLLQLKDPLWSVGSHKSFIPTIKSILSQSFWLCSLKMGIDPSEKFIKELQNDLEMVYVGQTCLSWEFLCWQYEKSRQLPESDPYWNHQYNQVAEEFQQFQVILQRFIEDEAFQGPRLPNYVKNRCVVQNLLQVPAIRQDSWKEKMEDQHKGNYVVTSEILEDIMEESLRIFGEFVNADKDETPGILKGLSGTCVEIQDRADFKLMADIQSNLQKKEKKLKDILRTGNCLVKKFKKPKEERSNQDLFFSQVDLKLVARVLRMPRMTTEQLMWCHAKLSNIAFIEGKVHREPSFLLFPC